MDFFDILNNNIVNIYDVRIFRINTWFNNKLVICYQVICILFIYLGFTVIDLNSAALDTILYAPSKDVQFYCDLSSSPV